MSPFVFFIAGGGNVRRISPFAAVQRHILTRRRFRSAGRLLFYFYFADGGPDDFTEFPFRCFKTNRRFGAYD